MTLQVYKCRTENTYRIEGEKVGQTLTATQLRCVERGASHMDVHAYGYIQTFLIERFGRWKVGSCKQAP